jgi:hypothetical protein
VGFLARQSGLPKTAGAAARLRRCVRRPPPLWPEDTSAEGGHRAIDRHSQEALVVVVNDYDADTHYSLMAPTSLKKPSVGGSRLAGWRRRDFGRGRSSQNHFHIFRKRPVAGN